MVLFIILSQHVELYRLIDYVLYTVRLKEKRKHTVVVRCLGIQLCFRHFTKGNNFYYLLFASLDNVVLSNKDMKCSVILSL